MLAIESLVHALTLSIGRNRRGIGVLKGVGFTRRQVGATISCQATAFTMVALVTAIPIGVFAGRQGWRLVAQGLGVPSVPIIPTVSVAGIAVTTLMLANLAGAYPARRAARLPTSVALRSE